MASILITLAFIFAIASVVAMVTHKPNTLGNVMLVGFPVLVVLTLGVALVLS